MSKNSYRFDPLVVSKTLLTRADSGLVRKSDSISTPGGALFELSWEGDGFLLTAPFGEHRFERSQLETAEADALWESAFGICKHMEEDHADTFPKFLKQVDHEWVEGAEIRMPWVECSGFFLRVAEQHVFVPFPETCPTSNEVRKTLIKMLRNNDRSTS